MPGKGKVIVSRDVTFLVNFEKDRKFEDFITEKIQKKFIELDLTHKEIPPPIERNLGEELLPLEGGEDSSDTESEYEMNPAQREELQEQNQPKKIYAEAQESHRNSTLRKF